MNNSYVHGTWLFIGWNWKNKNGMEGKGKEKDLVQQSLSH